MPTVLGIGRCGNVVVPQYLCRRNSDGTVRELWMDRRSCDAGQSTGE